MANSKVNFNLIAAFDSSLPTLINKFGFKNKNEIDYNFKKISQRLSNKSLIYNYKKTFRFLQPKLHKNCF